MLEQCCSYQLTRLAACFALLAQILPINSGQTQGIVPPPRHDSTSPQGVSYRSGSFSYSEADLSIGDGFPRGLRLDRNYNSSDNLPPDIYAATVGWTHSLLGFVSNQMVPVNPDDSLPPPEKRRYIYQVSLGGKSYGFFGGSTYPPATGGPAGAYHPVSPSGTSLVFNSASSPAYYTFTDADGSVVNFTAGANGRISDWTFPDGTRLDFTYTSAQVLRAVISNRGYAILFESSTKICAVNMAQTYVGATSLCPTDAQTVTYGYTSSSYNPPTSLLTTATKNGATTTYGYVSADHLGCVTFPGQSVCRIQNQFNVICPADPKNPNFQPWVRLNDPVTQQLDASARTFAYSYSFNLCASFNGDPDYRPFLPSTTTLKVNSVQNTAVTSNTASLPTSISDPLGRVTTLSYFGNSDWDIENVLPSVTTLPESNGVSLGYDARGNISSSIQIAKPNSGTPNITMTASYPTVCVNRKTCNKPDYIIDAKNNQTDYTYDSNSGGIATDTGPPVNGIRPQTRYNYTQRYAWIKNSSSSYAQVSTPVWVLNFVAFCKTSSTVNGTCMGGAADEVVTTYDYGPNSGPNNLQVRGKTVSADGTSLRTCYGYDSNGNKISETAPNAALTSCP